MSSAAARKPGQAPPPGEGPLSRFELGAELARGGMGVVHAAVDTLTGEAVAVKILLDESNDEARARFLREVRATSALSCPWICRPVAWGVGAEGDKSFLAMEFIDGPTLNALGRQARKAADVDPSAALPASVVVEILRQMLEGLAVAHAASVLHRDLKPANVMITKDGQVKLLDFGIARANTDRTVTKTGELVGTPQFMSPEQARGEELDARSDLFSAGVTIQSLIRGVHRFRGLEPAQALVRAMSEATAPLLEEAPGMPVALDSVLAALTALSRHNRVPDARAALAMMEASGMLRDDGPALLASSVADHVHRSVATARRENIAAAALEVQHARQLQQVAGSEAAALLALQRAATLHPDGEAPALREAWAQSKQLTLQEPQDPAHAALVATALAEATAAWRDPMRAAVCYRRAADLYRTARSPGRQAACLWRYVRERGDDALALQQLRVLLDGAQPKSGVHHRLSTRSIVAGIQTGGKFIPEHRQGGAATVVQRPAPPPSGVAGAGTAPSVVLVAGASPATAGLGGLARVTIAVAVVAAAVLVFRLMVDTAGATREQLAARDAPASVTQQAVARQDTHRMVDARAALAARNWTLARTLTSEILQASPTLEDGQEARAIRARAALALNDAERARADLEAYRSRVTRDDDPFLAEANALLARLREAPAAAALR